MTDSLSSNLAGNPSPARFDEPLRMALEQARDFIRAFATPEGHDNPDLRAAQSRGMVKHINAILAASPTAAAVTISTKSDAAVAAIQYALSSSCDGNADARDFLRYWNEGEFDLIRRNWVDAPEEVFIGADPLHPCSHP